MMSTKGPGLYEFLTESELQQYFNAFKKDLKVHNVGQLKFVTEEDLASLGMSRPEIRRLKKYFQKYCPQTYLSKFKKILLPKKDGPENAGVIIPEEGGDRAGVRVPSKHIIPADAIVINKELGVGEFGVVQQGVWTNEEGERIQVAIKCLSKDRMQSQPMEFLKEAAIMHTIDSEHIVRLYGVVLDTNALMLVTELAPLRSLLECLKEPSLRVSFPVTTLCDFCVQICDGMCYLESKRLIHRDLAARNILVFSKNKIKISDFGLSRALGVGKDYYQTNFNVNLKLPIAWCAPECINYLRFTSASDVWAFGVTLWELFSYGFQPWAALTGQQILEAIDEPNFQRLEQPEVCPKEYYTIMLKCWQHDPAKRPKFADLINILPDLKPEQMQAVKEMDENATTSPTKRERLHYGVGDIITVLDKRPLSDNPSVWKGVLKNSKTGLFSPANTVAYLGTSVPSNKSVFQRGDGKNAYSSRRRLRPEMISGPQGDFKHTGHVGLDGAYFGDVSFLGDKYHQLPKQIVTPYKPSEDEQSSLTRASSDVSDRAPLLKKDGEKGKFGPASEQHWSDTASEDPPESPGWSTTKSTTSAWSTLKSEVSNPVQKSEKANNDHEYHEISDEEENIEPNKEKGEGNAFLRDSFDLGPSLMDEVFRALGGSSSTTGPSPTDPPGSLPPLLPSQNSPPSSLSHSTTNNEDDANINVKNEIKEIASKFSSKKKQATVKPISATDERTLDSAIAMANELASKSMLRLDGSLEAINGEENHHSNVDSPSTPTSPAKSSKFSFKFSSRVSPKQERRHFSEEAASIADIQSSITEEAKEVYNSLVERPSPTRGSLPLERGDSPTPDSSEAPAHHNPLRMLRQGVTVRPKVRGNKHNLNGAGNTLDRNAGGRRSSRGSSSSVPSAAGNAFDLTTHQTLPRGFKTHKVPPPVKPKPPPLSLTTQDDVTSQEDSGSVDSEGSANNPLPLPPRDRSKTPSTPNKPRHQRKYPLIIPGGVANSLLRVSGNSEPKVESPPRLLIQHTHNPHLEASSSTSEGSPQRDSSSSPTPTKIPPAKPPRLFSPSPDDSFESQLACEMDALDEIQGDPGGLSPVGVAPPAFPGVEGEVPGRGSLYQSSDHVSCEDLLDFAMDKPNSRRTQGPTHGTQSDEVNLLMKVLKHEVTAEECVETLDECNWDVHRALKLLRLRLLLPNSSHSVSTTKTALEAFSWDVSKTASYLAATSSLEGDDTAQV